MVLIRTVFVGSHASKWNTLLGAGVLGDGFGAFTDGVLGELTGQQQAHGGLDLATRDRRSLVVVSKAGSLGGDALENVVDEAVHDAHRLGRDTGVGVDLLQHFVNVDGIALLPPAFTLLVSLADVLLGLARFLRCFSARLRWHVESIRFK